MVQTAPARPKIPTKSPQPARAQPAGTRALAADVAKLGQAQGSLRDAYELMACFAAYTGLRWGEIAALTLAQIDQAARVVTVDRKIIEIGPVMCRQRSLPR